MVVDRPRVARGLCFVLVVLALAATDQGMVCAQSYFVDPLGSDANPGTAGLPWRTLQHAANTVSAGATVHVRSGQYVGFYLDGDHDGSSSINPVTFLAQPGALITQRNATTPDGINLEGASYVVIDGFSVTGMPRAGVRTVLGTDVTVRNVHAFDNERWGIFTGFVDRLLIENNETSGSRLEHGIYVSNSGDDPVVRRNLTWGNRGAGIHMNADHSEGGDGIISRALVSGNVVYGNAAKLNNTTYGGGSGINMDGVQDSRIENNLLFDNHASGISLFRQDGLEGSRNNVVVNNTIHQPIESRWALNIQQDSTDNTVLNNILFSEHPSRGAIDVSEEARPSLVSDYNAVIARFATVDGGNELNLDLVEWQALTGQDAHSFAVELAMDLFVNWQAGDYRTKPGSLALNTGTNQLAPAVDVHGIARPAGAVDVGAWEGTAFAAADVNRDGIVNLVDLAIWKSNVGRRGTADRAWGDASADFRVDGADLLMWQRQVAPGAAAPVPEPATLLLLAWGAALARPRAYWRR
jgi:parallel beta-helix repeat protein